MREISWVAEDVLASAVWSKLGIAQQPAGCGENNCEKYWNVLCLKAFMSE
jgi:hypothetical protein